MITYDLSNSIIPHFSVASEAATRATPAKAKIQTVKAKRLSIQLIYYYNT